jgi:hypothetical protein
VSGPVKVAQAGYGYAGKTFHAPLIEATHAMELRWVVSGNERKVRADYPDMQVVDKPFTITLAARTISTFTRLAFCHRNRRVGFPYCP